MFFTSALTALLNRNVAFNGNCDLHTRVIPAPDVYAMCPSDGRILEYYSGTYDSVYVSLSPFIQPVTISRDLFCPDSYPDRLTIQTSCKAVRWADVATGADLPNLAAVDIGLRTQVGGLKKAVANADYSNRLGDFCEATGLIPPPEGEHSDLLHNNVLGLFQELGHESVWVGDEFCTERKLHWIEDLKTETVPTIGGHCNVFSPDKSLLWAVHWDSHFSFLCSARRNLDRVGVASSLEGFYCTPETEVYWSLHVV